MYERKTLISLQNNRKDNYDSEQTFINLHKIIAFYNIFYNVFMRAVYILTLKINLNNNLFAEKNSILSIID